MQIFRDGAIAYDSIDNAATVQYVTVEAFKLNDK